MPGLGRQLSGTEGLVRWRRKEDWFTCLEDTRVSGRFDSDFRSDAGWVTNCDRDAWKHWGALF
jgi:hypothetical protein